MSLGNLQRQFTLSISHLIAFAYNRGYELTFGDAFRDHRVPYGHPRSAHKSRLAVDLNLFENGVYLQKTEHHKTLGDYWKTLHPLARWGGDFQDGNHYSFEYNGVK